MNFQASDSAHQASVHAARLAVRRAQRSFDLASKREHIGKEEPWPVSDEEDEAAEDMTVDSKEESAQKIHDGMSSIVASLEELSSSADLLEQRVNVREPRWATKRHQRPKGRLFERPAIRDKCVRSPGANAPSNHGPPCGPATLEHSILQERDFWTNGKRRYMRQH